MSRFVELQGGEPEGGFVFRKFIEFQSIGLHSTSRMPLTCEFRLFFLYNKPFMTLKYWEDGEYEEVSPPLDEFTEIAPHIKSHFFTMDIAKSKDGEWIIVELGDGQVAGLPEHADIQEFYRQIHIVSQSLSHNG